MGYQKFKTNWVPIIDDDKKVNIITNEIISNLRKIKINDNIKFLEDKNYGSLAEGTCGIALTCGYLNKIYPNSSWDKLAHDYLKYSLEKQSYSQSISLFSGLSGMAFTASYLSQGSSRYKNLLDNLNKLIIKKTANTIKDLIESKRSTPVWRYDLMSGLVGVGTYILYNNELFNNKLLNDVLKDILNVLIYRINLNDDLLGFYTSQRDINWVGSSAKDIKKYKNGIIDCGISHGISGVLALLAKSYITEKKDVDGIKDGMETIMKWLTKFKTDDKFGIGWYGILPFNETTNSFILQKQSKIHIRDIWCYGSIGIASALFTSGNVIKNDYYIKLSLNAIDGMLKRLERENLPYYFCHGLSGILQGLLHIYNYTNKKQFKDNSSVILNKIERVYETKLTNNKNLGLLTGNSGILLSLLSASTKINPEWDRVFLY